MLIDYFLKIYSFLKLFYYSIQADFVSSYLDFILITVGS